MSDNNLFGLEEKKIRRHIIKNIKSNKTKLAYINKVKTVVKLILHDKKDFEIKNQQLITSCHYLKYFGKSIISKHSGLSDAKLKQKFIQEIEKLTRLLEVVETLEDFYSKKPPTDLQESLVFPKRKRSKKLGNADGNCIARIFFAMKEAKIIDTIPNRRSLADILVEPSYNEKFQSSFSKNYSLISRAYKNKTEGVKSNVRKNGELLNDFLIQIIKSNYDTIDDVIKLIKPTKK